MQSNPFFTTTLLMTLSLLGVCQWVNGQAQPDSMTDQDGNTYPVKIMIDKNQWMTKNLTIQVEDSYCYADKPTYCQEYGRLYTFQSAVKACTLLGEGWRLPTNDEWASLARPFGGVRDQSTDGGKTAYKAMLAGGSADFNVLLGGGRESDGKTYARLQAHGFFWTATENGNGTAWLYNFGAGAQLLNRHADGNKQTALSVRCIRSVQK